MSEQSQAKLTGRPSMLPIRRRGASLRPPHHLASPKRSQPCMIEPRRVSDQSRSRFSSFRRAVLGTRQARHVDQAGAQPHVSSCRTMLLRPRAPRSLRNQPANPLRHPAGPLSPPPARRTREGPRRSATDLIFALRHAEDPPMISNTLRRQKTVGDAPRRIGLWHAPYRRRLAGRSASSGMVGTRCVHNIEREAMLRRTSSHLGGRAAVSACLARGRECSAKGRDRSARCRRTFEECSRARAVGLRGLRLTATGLSLSAAACAHVHARSNRARFSFSVLDSAAQRRASSAYCRN